MSVRIQGRLYSEGTATRAVDAWLAVDVGAGPLVHYLPAGATLFLDALAAWQASLGAGWTVAYSATTRRVTISRVAGNFGLVLGAGVAALLGFASTGYAGQATYTGEGLPAGLVECLGLDVRPADDAQRIELRQYRHGRSIATAWGNTQQFDVVAHLTAATAATLTGPSAGYCLGGPVRLERGDATAYNATNPDGYLDAWVIGVKAVQERGASRDFVEVEFRVAVDTRMAAPAMATGTALCPLAAGWGVVWAVLIEGVPVVFVERATGFAMPSGWTSEDASLSLDDCEALGSEVDRARGVGIGLSANFRLLESAAVKALMRAPATVAQLGAPVTAAEVASIAVDSTTGWPAAGDLHIGLERVSYANTDATHFLGLTRGQGGWAYAHRIGSAGSMLTGLPRWWIGRDVQIWAIPVDPGGYCDSSDGGLLTDAEMVWRGRIDGGPARVADGWDFSAVSLDRILDRPLVAKQTGKIVDNLPRYTCTPATVWPATIELRKGPLVVAAAALVIEPFAALLAGSLYSGAELRAAISAAWDDAVAAAGAGAWLGGLTWSPLKGDGLDGLWLVRLTVIGDGAKTGYHYLSIQWALGHVDGWGIGDPTTDTKIIIGTQIADNPVIQVLAGSAGGGAALAVELSEGDPALVSATAGVVKVGETAYRYLAATSQDSTVYLSGVTRFDGGTLKASDFAVLVPGAQAELRHEASAAHVGTLALAVLESSGTAGLRGAYDTLARGEGYGLDADLVNEGSMLAPPSALGALAVRGDVAGSTAADLACSALGLCRSAVVARRDAAGSAVRLALVSTDGACSDWLATISGSDMLGIGEDPCRLEPRAQVPTTITVERSVAGAQEADRIVATDLPAADAMGAVEQAHKIPAESLDALRILVQQQAAATFLGDQTAQAVTIRVGPWIDVHVGDAVWLELGHPVVWDWIAGAAGYSGPGRVVARKLSPRSLVAELTVLFDGGLRASCLSPAAEISAAGVGWVEVSLAYLGHFAQAIAEAGGQVKCLHYRPGQTEDDAANWTHVDAASDVAGVCRLSVSDWNGEAASVADATTLTLPLGSDAALTAYQRGFAHDDDATRWI